MSAMSTLAVYFMRKLGFLQGKLAEETEGVGVLVIRSMNRTCYNTYYVSTTEWVDSSSEIHHAKVHSERTFYVPCRSSPPLINKTYYDGFFIKSPSTFQPVHCACKWVLQQYKAILTALEQFVKSIKDNMVDLLYMKRLVALALASIFHCSSDSQ